MEQPTRADPPLPQPAPPAPAPSAAPVRTVARRSRRVGGVIAVLLLLALGGLAWYLTHKPVAPGGPGGAMAGGPGGGPPVAGGPGGGAGGAGGRRGATASTVGVASARQADIPVVIEALGTVTPLANVTVQPQVAGVLTQVLFKEGQMVRRGDVLATIDPKPFQIALDQAQGARVRDEAQLQAAKVTLQRYQTLLAQDSIARQDVDTQAALVQQLQGTVAIDRASEGTARLNLGYSRIVAPVDGRVGLRPVDAGNYVSTGSSGGIAVITQLTPIDVAFAVPQSRVPEIQARLRSGATLPAAAWDQNRVKRLDVGSFVTLDNSVDTQTGTVKAKARFANAEANLYPNQFVNLRLLLRTVNAAVVVPVTAMRHGPDGDFVYVVNDDRTVSLRTVTRGEANVDNVAVTSGLKSGEQVVTEGGDRLKDGARVQTSAERPAGAASAAASAGRGRGRRGLEGASAAAFGASGAASSGASGGFGGRRRDGAGTGGVAQ